MSTNAIAYDLFWDCSHLKGKVYDATLVPFPDSGYAMGWVGAKPREVPNPVLFEANFKVTQHSDYPCNDVGWPLMAPRMLDVLRRVGDFRHRIIPVRLVNRKVRGPARYLPDGSLRPEMVDDRFVAVQITEHIDVVDWERSTFRRSPLNPAKIAFFYKLVLVEPPGGLPPLFRVPSKVSLLLVSAEARRALEAAGIRGVEFDPLPGANEAEDHAAGSS
jgi:hypothetical protein